MAPSSLLLTPQIPLPLSLSPSLPLSLSQSNKVPVVQHPHHVHPLTPLITYSNEHFTPGNPPPHLQGDVDPKTGTRHTLTRSNSHSFTHSLTHSLLHSLTQSLTLFHTYTHTHGHTHNSTLHAFTPSPPPLSSPSNMDMSP